MRSIGVAELKAHLSEHLRAVRGGEPITILDRQQPVARLVPIAVGAGEISSRPARGLLHDVRMPRPIRGATGDVVSTLLEERKERG
jgi:prevent-host-death family protein